MTAHPSGASYGYPAAAGPDRPAGARRPVLLNLAIVCGGLVMSLSLTTAVAGFTSGRATVEDTLRSGLGIDARNLPADLIAPAVDDAYRTIQIRAGLIAFFAVMIGLLTLASMRASIVARIMLALGLLLAVGAIVLALRDVYPSGGTVPGGTAIVLAVVMMVLLFLPAVNRYRTARRQARQAPTM